MPVSTKRLTASIAICAMLLITQLAGSRQAIAASARPADDKFHLTTGSKVALGVGIGAVAVGTVVIVYFAVRHNHTLTGCATTTPDGLQIFREGDTQPWIAIGETAGIKSGDRVRLHGKKQKKGATRQFLVEQLSKDYGPCKVMPPTIGTK